jgi:hypothetical protein
MLLMGPVLQKDANLNFIKTVGMFFRGKTCTEGKRCHEIVICLRKSGNSAFDTRFKNAAEDGEMKCNSHSVQSTYCFYSSNQFQ